MWSIYWYFQDTGITNEAYLSSKLLTTPLGNDHVRFSWLVSIAIFFCIWHLTTFDFKLPLPVMVVVIAWLIIYLHILGSRMGLISFYGGMLIFLIAHLNKSMGARISLVVLLLLPVGAYFFLPTFQNRIKYLRYDASFYLKGNYQSGTTDGNRVASWKCGAEILSNNLLFGTGAGDVHTETTKCYTDKKLNMQQHDMILPGSELLMYGLFAGIPGLILFLFAIVTPFLERVRHYLFWNVICATAIFSILFDIGLEVQYGVISFSFLLLVLNDYLSREKKI